MYICKYGCYEGKLLIVMETKYSSAPVFVNLFKQETQCDRKTKVSEKEEI